MLNWFKSFTKKEKKTFIQFSWSEDRSETLFEYNIVDGEEEEFGRLLFQVCLSFADLELHKIPEKLKEDLSSSSYKEIMNIFTDLESQHNQLCDIFQGSLDTGGGPVIKPTQVFGRLGEQ